MRYYLILILFMVVDIPLASAQQASVEQCQRYKDKSDYYQDLRRQGGRGPQMDDWKNRMREYDKKFNHGNCQKHRGKLKH